MSISSNSGILTYCLLPKRYCVFSVKHTFHAYALDFLCVQYIVNGELLGEFSDTSNCRE